jgi:hypothetical protein
MATSCPGYTAPDCRALVRTLPGDPAPENQRTEARLSDRIPPVVYVLGGVIFLMGTTEYMVAGLLPEISSGLHVSVARTGLLITAFAVGMIVGAPPCRWRRCGCRAVSP